MSANLLAIEATGVVARFGGVVALDRVDLHVRPAVVHGVIGPNGAGKTTLFNVITGFTPLHTGTVALFGADITRMRPHRIARAGLARTFQSIRLYPDLSVLENVMLGGYALNSASFLDRLLCLPRDGAEHRKVRRAALTALEVVGLRDRADDRAGSLPYGGQRRVDIARALVSGPRVLLLDEPSAGLNTAEADSLMGLIRRLKADGLTVVVIEHNMRLMLSVADRITVLNFGRRLAEDTADKIPGIPSVVEAYLGERAVT